MIPGTASPTYEALMLAFLPRPIKNEEDYEAVQMKVDHLVDKGALTAEHIDRLAAFFGVRHGLFFERGGEG